MSVYCGTIVKSDRSNRRIPKNPKYAHVKSVVDTGSSLSKIKVISMREYINRKCEIFKRIKGSELSAILSQTAGDDDDGEDTYEEDGKREISSPRSEDSEEEERPTSPSNGRSFLILDLRSREQFEACHIVGALNFPDKNLRADRTRDLYRYRDRMRKEGFCFIVYDNDERVAIPSATTLVQKGWENVLMLTKGLSSFATKYPDVIVGDPPVVETPRSVAGSVGARRSRAGRPRRHHRSRLNRTNLSRLNRRGK